MSNLHLTRAIEVGEKRQLQERQRHALVILGNWACEYCGLTWPSVPRLAGAIGCGTTAAREALKALAGENLIELRAYARGGGKCSTQYIVLPADFKLEDAPCAVCRENLKLGRKRGPRPAPPATETQRRGGGFTRVEVNGATLSSSGSKRQGDVEPNGSGGRSHRPKSTHPVRELFASGHIGTRAASRDGVDDTKLNPDTTARSRAREAERAAPALFETSQPPPSSLEARNEFVRQFERYAPAAAARLRERIATADAATAAQSEPRNPHAAAPSPRSSRRTP